MLQACWTQVYGETFFLIIRQSKQERSIAVMKSRQWRFLAGALLFLLALTACDSGKKEAEAPAPAPADMAQPAGEQPAISLKGTVKEVQNGGGFTYALLATDQGETWVAMAETEVAVGEKISVLSGQLFENFPSKALNRTFSELVFASEVEGKESRVSNSPHGSMAMPPASPGGGDFKAAMQKESGGSGMAIDPAGTAAGSGKAIVPFADLKVKKATGENAKTVADIFANATALNGKTVKVRGRVVKFSPGIMGKNWLHLQDGTGDPNKNTHDLVVTTNTEATKGEEVTVEGVLAANKDFGFGYKYDAIVEDVKISR
jgi:hypothetical protein